MSRKLAIGAVSLLGLLSLVVSAQPPADSTSPPTAHGPQSTAPAGVLPPLAGRQSVTPGSAYAVGLLRSTASREESELAQQSDELVNQLRKAEGEDKEKLKTRLTETLGKQFDARQKRQQAEIAALEEQVKKLKERVQKRQENRKEIISKRLEQLVREAEGIGW